MRYELRSRFKGGIPPLLASGHPPDDWIQALAEARAEGQRLQQLAAALRPLDLRSMANRGSASVLEKAMQYTVMTEGQCIPLDDLPEDLAALTARRRRACVPGARLRHSPVRRHGPISCGAPRTAGSIPSSGSLTNAKVPWWGPWRLMVAEG